MDMIRIGRHLDRESQTTPGGRDLRYSITIGNGSEVKIMKPRTRAWVGAAVDM